MMTDKELAKFKQLTASEECPTDEEGCGTHDCPCPGQCVHEKPDATTEESSSLSQFMRRTMKKRTRNPIDMYGSTINAGDYINYPVRKGSSIYMRTAKVISVRQREDHLDNPQMVLDVAVAIAPRAWERASNKNWQDDVQIRRVTVSRPHRATILPEEYIKSDKRYSVLVAI